MEGKRHGRWEICHDDEFNTVEYGSYVNGKKDGVWVRRLWLPGNYIRDAEVILR